MNRSFSPDTSQHLHQLLDHVPSMLAYWDRELRCRFANRAYEHWFGIDPDKLVGTTLLDLLGAPLFELNEPHIRAALHGQEQLFERVVPGPEGRRRHSLAHYLPDTVDGEVMGFIAHVTDVTLLKETEATLRAETVQRDIALVQLRESKAALVEAQRLGGVGSWEWVIEPDITVWSDELYRIFARDPNLPPPTYAEHPSLYSPESWDRLQTAVTSALQTGAPYSLELEYRQADGRSGWLEARGEAVRGPTGGISRLRGTVHEVSLRHAMEDARVIARAAESASRNKTLFLSRVSHELRTPLNGILGLSNLMHRDVTLQAKHRRWASIIDSSGQHMLELVEEVLDLAAAEAGRVEVQCVDIEPFWIIQDCLLRASAAAMAAQITLLEVDADTSHIHALGDAKRLKQVIDNLVSNSIKFTPAGGSVHVTLKPYVSGVELAVHDTGDGLTAAQIEQVFQPFERLGAETSAIPGTGLGLALSKMLVELMGGSIRVESEPGRGSTFTVSLQGVSAGD